MVTFIRGRRAKVPGVGCARGNNVCTMHIARTVSKTGRTELPPPSGSEAHILEFWSHLFFFIRDFSACRLSWIFGVWAASGGRGTFQKSTISGRPTKNMQTNPRRALRNAMRCVPLQRAVGPGSLSLQGLAMAVDEFCGFDSWTNQHCKTTPADPHHLGVRAWPAVRRIYSHQQSALQVSSRSFSCMLCGPWLYWQRRFSL